MSDKPGSDLSIHLGDLHDVDRGTPEVGDTLIFNGTKWVPGAPTGGGGDVDLTNYDGDVDVQDGVLQIVGEPSTQATWILYVDGSPGPVNFPDGGTWTVDVNGQTSDPIAWDADDATILSVLGPLTSDGIGFHGDGRLTTTAQLGLEVLGSDAQGSLSPTYISDPDGSNLTGPLAPYTLAITNSEPGSPVGGDVIIQGKLLSITSTGPDGITLQSTNREGVLNASASSVQISGESDDGAVTSSVDLYAQQLGGTISATAQAEVHVRATAVEGVIHLESGVLNLDAAEIGFFTAEPVVKPTGVAVTPEAIHAALVTLGLISA